MPMTETDLERIRESLRLAPASAQEALAWSKRARVDLLDLLQLAEKHFEAQGGSFGVHLREALEERILEKLNGRTELTDDTQEVSLGVHVTQLGVVVDVRLTIGRWKQ
jgi:hypothetical protein